MLQDPFKWRRLVHEYSTLRELWNGITPQIRGQRFNSLIAELFACFGIAAKANQSSVGELDVTFSHGGRRFILEAKWEKKKVGTGPIAKLQRRVEQRMVGVFGVFLSMSGYSPDALAEIDKGRRLDMVLLDQRHWEAMLSGFVPPSELIDMVTDSASFRGQAYTPLDKLFDERPVVSRMTFNPSSGPVNSILRPIAGNVNFEVVLDGFESRKLGVFAYDKSRMLITTDQGVATVDLARRTVEWALSLRGAHGSPILHDGSILVQREYGVGRYRNGVLLAMSSGGSVSGASQLLFRPDGSAWCFDPGAVQADHSTPASLIELGQEVGDEKMTDLPYKPGVATGATWLNDTDIVLAGPDVPVVSSLDVGEQYKALPGLLPAAVMALDGRKVMVLDNDSTMWVVDLATEQRAPMWQVDGVDVLACYLTRGSDDTVYVAVRYRRGSAVSRIAVVRTYATGPWLPAVETPSAPTRRAEGQNHVVHELSSLELTSANSDCGHVAAEVTPTPGNAGSVEGQSSKPDHMSDEIRLADEHRGLKDGQSAAMTLPLYALEGAAVVDFDMVRWLIPWREGWRLITLGQAPPQAQLVNWLPLIARHLGSYAAPAEHVSSHFTPSLSYVAGYGNGMRAAWEKAVRRRVLSNDPSVLKAWMAQPVARGSGIRDGVLNGTLTLKEMYAAAVRSRVANLWKWVGRVALWIFTFFFGVGTLIAIFLTATDGWPTHTLANSVGGLLFYTIPFAGLLLLTILDLCRLHAKKKGRG